MSTKKIAYSLFFSAALKHVMKTKRLKEKDVAEIINVKAPVVNKWKSGKINIGVDTAAKIADALGYDLLAFLEIGREILGGDEDPRTVGETEEGFTPEQVQAIEAFKACLRFGGEGAEMLSRQAIDLAKRKEIEAEYQNPTKKRFSKSA